MIAMIALLRDRLAERRADRLVRERLADAEALVERRARPVATSAGSQRRRRDLERRCAPSSLSVTRWIFASLEAGRAQHRRAPGPRWPDCSSAGLDPRARLEVDAEVQALAADRERADEQDHARHREEPPRRAHEVEVPAPALLAGAERARVREHARAAHACRGSPGSRARP